MHNTDEDHTPLKQIYRLGLAAGVSWLVVVFVASCLYDLCAWEYVTWRGVCKTSHVVDKIGIGFYIVMLFVWCLSCATISARYGIRRALRCAIGGVAFFAIAHFGAVVCKWVARVAAEMFYDHIRLAFRDHFWMACGATLLAVGGVPIVAFRRNRYGAPSALLRLLRHVMERVETNNRYVAVFVLTKMRFGRDHNAGSLIRVARIQRQYSHRDAITTFSRALDIDPSNSVACHLRGDEWRSLHEYEKSEADLRRALELDDRSFRVARCLGRTLDFSEQEDAALVQYSRAIQLNPDFADAYLSRAWVRSSGNEYEAREDFLKVVELDHTNGDAFRGLFLVSVRLGEPDDAKKYFLLARKFGEHLDSELVRIAEQSLKIRLV